MDIEAIEKSSLDYTPQLDVYATLWKRKWIIVSATIVTSALALVAVAFVPKHYEATVIVLPVSDSSVGSKLGALGAIASQLGGIASLTGLADNDRQTEAVAVLQSEVLTETYIQENNLLPTLFPKEWDTSSQHWKSLPTDQLPTLWKANQLFKKNIRQLTTNAKSGLVTLSIDWTNPSDAAKWANGLVDLTNKYLREKAITESERNIKYLSAQATNANEVELKQAIYSLMQSEINKAMIARGTEEYAFKVIDPARVPEKSSSPKKSLWLLGGFVLGIALSAGPTLLRAFARPSAPLH